MCKCNCCASAKVSAISGAAPLQGVCICRDHARACCAQAQALRKRRRRASAGVAKAQALRRSRRKGCAGAQSPQVQGPRVNFSNKIRNLISCACGPHQSMRREVTLFNHIVIKRKACICARFAEAQGPRSTPGLQKRRGHASAEACAAFALAQPLRLRSSCACATPCACSTLATAQLLRLCRCSACACLAPPQKAQQSRAPLVKGA